MKNNYYVIEATTLNDLESSVNFFMSEGWTPQGGISVIILMTTAYYYQAMVYNEYLPQS